MISNRRSFLRGLSTLPLIGGGVTLIGRAAATPVPLTHAAAAPIMNDPRERARYAWAALSSAMREITAGEHGWRVTGSEALPFGDLPSKSWVAFEALRYSTGDEPRCPGLIVDRYRRIDL